MHAKSNILFLHMPSRLLCHNKIVIKTLLPLGLSCKKGKNQLWQDRPQLPHEASLPGLYCSFWKLFCWGRMCRCQCLLENTQFLHSRERKELLLDGFSYCKFCCRHRVTRRCIAFVCLLQWSWFVYHTAAYCICILIIWIIYAPSPPYKL